MALQKLYDHYLKHPVVCTDTRDIQPNSIFFALKGEKFNANEFAEKALNAGSALAVIDDAKYKLDERFFLVDDVLQTLQDLARYHRQQLSIPVIAITGSNGKTTSKELINAVLSQKFNVLSTKGNLNNHIGVPLTLLTITAKHEIAIIEMGANHQGEIAFLCSIAQPDYGMITNIGKAHLEGFGGYEGVKKAKGEMYTYIKQRGGKLFVNMDNPLLNELSLGINKINFGSAATADYIGKFLESNPFVKLQCKAKEEEGELAKQPVITTHLIGGYNFENILAAACIGHFLKLSQAQIKAGLESYVPSNNRSQIVQTADNFLLLDAYNANPSSMKVAIENFAAMDRTNKMVILGDMLELGNESDQEHDFIVKLLHQQQLTNVILVGPNFAKAGKNTSAITFATSAEVKQYLHQHKPSNHTILIKGSRGIKLEVVVEEL